MSDFRKSDSSYFEAVTSLGQTFFDKMHEEMENDTRLHENFVVLDGLEVSLDKENNVLTVKSNYGLLEFDTDDYMEDTYHYVFPGTDFDLHISKSVYDAL